VGLKNASNKVEEDNPQYGWTFNSPVSRDLTADCRSVLSAVCCWTGPIGFMRKCEICEWYTGAGKGLVSCSKKEILFHYGECDIYERDKFRLFWGR